MSNINFTFSTSTTAFSAYTPVTITFQPSATYANYRFLSKLVYQFPDKTIVRTNTFTSYNEAITTYKDIDCRANLTYTLPGDLATTSTISVSAYIGPDLFSPSVFTLTITPLAPYFTRNPLASSNPFAFGEVHLLKNRAWGSDNKQLFILESKAPNYLLVNLG